MSTFPTSDQISRHRTCNAVASYFSPVCSRFRGVQISRRHFSSRPGQCVTDGSLCGQNTLLLGWKNSLRQHL